MARTIDTVDNNKLRMTTVLTIQFPDKPIVQIVSNTIARINTV